MPLQSTVNGKRLSYLLASDAPDYIHGCQDVTSDCMPAMMSLYLCFYYRTSWHQIIQIKLLKDIIFNWRKQTTNIHISIEVRVAVSLVRITRVKLFLTSTMESKNVC